MMHTDEGNLNEHDHVLRLIAGDEDSFCFLYSRYKSRLQFFALTFLKSEEIAEDILQDVFTNIWLGRKLINPNVPFSSYLYVLVKHRALNELRSMERRHILRTHIEQNSADYCEETHDAILLDDLKKVLQKALAAMTPRQREVFQLSREGRLSYKEIAEQLNISVNTVHEHITGSLQIIRQYLNKFSETEIGIILLLLALYVK